MHRDAKRHVYFGRPHVIEGFAENILSKVEPEMRETTGHASYSS